MTSNQAETSQAETGAADAIPPTGPLAGIRVLDLSRVLAGPWATQILGDLGATIYKVEQPGQGDDTRRWGPPFLDDGSKDAAYYTCANRNKYSMAVDIASKAGADLIRRMVKDCDILVENFRVGGLAKYGLDYESLRRINPRLVYCSVTGFGQTGPYKDRGGYDFLVQGMSGLMSVTGRPDAVPGGGPMKVGVPVSDLSTGLYAAIGILAALRHAERTGQGQQIDCALLDVQVSLLANQASNYLNGGMIPVRLANEHPNTVPYQDFACADGDVLVALGNDRQFRAFCRMLGRSDLAEDPRFQDNASRNANRAPIQAEIGATLSEWTSEDLIARMEAAKLPGGKVNTIPTILEDPQIEHRQLVQTMKRRDGAEVRVLGFPAKFSATPVNYRLAPPRSGEDTVRVLGSAFGLSDEDIRTLSDDGVVAQQG